MQSNTAPIMLKVTAGTTSQMWPREDKTVTINRDDLSLYTTPEERFRYVEPEAGNLENGVATLRKSVEPYSAWWERNITPKVQSVTRFGSEARAYFKEPPESFYPRAGVIGLAGLGGLFLARGSRMKKSIYPLALMTAAASLYYPEQAVAIGRSIGDSVYDWALQGYLTIEKTLKPEKHQDTASYPKP